MGLGNGVAEMRHGTASVVRNFEGALPTPISPAGVSLPQVPQEGRGRRNIMAQLIFRHRLSGETGEQLPPPALHRGEVSAGATCRSPTVSPSLTLTPALSAPVSLGRPRVSFTDWGGGGGLCSSQQVPAHTGAT